MANAPTTIDPIGAAARKKAAAPNQVPPANDWPAGQLAGLFLCAGRKHFLTAHHEEGLSLSKACVEGFAPARVLRDANLSSLNGSSG
jgi:hypothetical protein